MTERLKEATFHARQSGRVAATSITTDHDLWKERLAVVDMLVPNNLGRQQRQPKYELQIRSFFESEISGKKYWDEPPSGANSIQYANDEMRRMAEMQKRDLECAYVKDNDDGDDGQEKKGRMLRNKMKNFFQKNKIKKKSNHEQEETSSSIQRNVTVKENSQTADFLNLPSTSMKKMNHNPERMNLEYALAQSMNDSNSYHQNHNHHITDYHNQMVRDTRTDLERALALSVNEIHNGTRDRRQKEEEEDIALATALSLSLNEMSTQHERQQHSPSHPMSNTDEVHMLKYIGTSKNIEENLLSFSEGEDDDLNTNGINKKNCRKIHC